MQAELACWSCGAAFGVGGIRDGPLKNMERRVPASIVLLWTAEYAAHKTSFNLCSAAACALTDHSQLNLSPEVSAFLGSKLGWFAFLQTVDEDELTVQSIELLQHLTDTTEVRVCVHSDGVSS